MRIDPLSKRMMYRELRSAIGYYDARRIIRLIEEEESNLKVDDLAQFLEEKHVDLRQISLAMDLIKKSIPED